PPSRVAPRGDHPAGPRGRRRRLRHHARRSGDLELMARKSAAGSKTENAYVVGIDLGTTNCALASVDVRKITDESTPPIEIFEVPQVVPPTPVEPRQVLPSFLYLPNPHELPDGALSLP